MLDARAIRDRIDAEFPLEPLEPSYRGEVARRYRYRDGQGEIGIIASVTQPFCGDCTRARLSADGHLYTCLFATRGADLKTPLRAGESDEQLAQRIAGIWRAREDRYSEERAEPGRRGRARAGRDVPDRRLSPVPVDPKVVEIARAIRSAGGRALLVGGCVRDRLRGEESKDQDVEVFGLDLPALEAALGRFGEVIAIGRAFGVLQVKGVAIDFSLPRRDSKVGAGHKGFEIAFDPGLDFAEAARRRDLTINSIGLDPLTEEILDPHGGRADLERGLLRATDPAHFSEDPLRGLRVAQFAARFEMRVDPALSRLCRALDLSELSGERVLEEWRKLLLKGVRPSRGLEFLRETDLLRFFPELAGTGRCTPGAGVAPRGRLLGAQPDGDRRGGAAARRRAGRSGADVRRPAPRRGQAADDRDRERACALAEPRRARRSARGRLPRAHARADRAGRAGLGDGRAPPGPRAVREERRDREGLPPARPQARRGRRVGRAPGAGRARRPLRPHDRGSARRSSSPRATSSSRRPAIWPSSTSAPRDVVLGRHLIARGLTPGVEFGQILERCRELQDETGWDDPERILNQVLGAKT